MEEKERQPRRDSDDRVRILSRTCTLLRLLNDHPDGLSIRELSLYSKLPITTVRRIIESIEGENIVIAVPGAKLFRLGPTLALFASNIRPFNIAVFSRPMLMQLADKTQEWVHLSVEAHGMAVVVDFIPGTYPLNSLTNIGASVPLHATASGKALLAALPEKELRSRRSQMTLTGFTANTLTNWEDLMAELETIRDSGIALDQEEYQMGICGIATPLRSPGGEIGAMGITFSTGRAPKVRDEILEQLKALPRPW